MLLESPRSEYYSAKTNSSIVSQCVTIFILLQEFLKINIRVCLSNMYYVKVLRDYFAKAYSCMLAGVASVSTGCFNWCILFR